MWHAFLNIKLFIVTNDLVFMAEASPCQAVIQNRRWVSKKLGVYFSKIVKAFHSALFQIPSWGLWNKYEYIRNCYVFLTLLTVCTN